MAFNDLFRSDAQKYWKNEGNNKRMQKYYRIAGILKTIEYIFTISLFIYFTFLSTQMLIDLLNNATLSNILNDKFIRTNILINNLLIFYSIIFAIFVSILICLLIKGKVGVAEIKRNIIIIIFLMPTIYLMFLSLQFPSNLIISILVLIIYNLLIHVINFLNNKIVSLYEIAIGSNNVKPIEMKERKRK